MHTNASFVIYYLAEHLKSTMDPRKPLSLLAAQRFFALALLLTATGTFLALGGIASAQVNGGMWGGELASWQRWSPSPPPPSIVVDRLPASIRLTTVVTFGACRGRAASGIPLRSGRRSRRRSCLLQRLAISKSLLSKLMHLSFHPCRPFATTIAWESTGRPPTR